jgi:hypothetical protein
MRAKTVWRYQFPREPLWRNHRLKEPMERMRELHAGEADAPAGALRPDFEPWFRFASATGLRLAETLIRSENVNWAAKTIVTIGKGGRTVSTPVTDTIAAILEPLKDHHPTAVFTFIGQRPKRGQHRGERAPLTYAGAKSEWRAARGRQGLQVPRRSPRLRDEALAANQEPQARLDRVEPCRRQNDCEVCACSDRRSGGGIATSITVKKVPRKVPRGKRKIIITH